MKCQNLKRFLLLLAVLLFLSLACYSEESVTLTAEQWQTFKTELQNLKTQIEIVEKQRDESRKAETELQSQVNALMTQLTVQSDLLEALSRSSQTLRAETWIDRFIWFSAGSLAGFVGGNYTGVKIGIAIN